MLHEVAAAYEIDANESEPFIMKTEEIPQLGETPVKIIHLLSLHQDQSPLYKQLQKQNKQTEIQLAYLLPEKLYKIPSIIQSFYKTNERIFMIYFCVYPHTIHKYQWSIGGRRMQTSVVMGAFQFVGFHLTKYLLDQGEEVIGIDWGDDIE